MKPSKYQQAVFDFITNGTGSAVVQACAGSGKTTTIIKALELIPLKCAKQPWQIEQETNLRYVGITRAKRELRFIQSELLVEKKPETKKSKKAA